MCLNRLLFILNSNLFSEDERGESDYLHSGEKRSVQIFEKAKPKLFTQCMYIIHLKQFAEEISQTTADTTGEN